MKIAYYTSYLGNEFRRKYCGGKSFAVSGTLKCQGIARALMLAGHEVVIYSPGITTCNMKIPAFTEEEKYPEGVLTIKYGNIFSFRKCAPVNDYLLGRFISRELKENQYDVFLYYNITLGAALNISKFRTSLKVIEYEDNIFNKALAGGKNDFVWAKTKLYNYLLQKTDAAVVVCKGMLVNNEVKHRVLVPGIINEEVIANVTSRINRIGLPKPVKIILTGGTHYSKGPDLLIKALKYIKYPCSIDFYGNGSFDAAAKEEIAKIPAIHSVQIKGYMPHKELIQILDKDADILVNTTRNMGVALNSAGFPFKMMEYASTGRPIVSSEIGKLDEEYNRHITYYESEDPESIAAAIEDVIENYDEKVRLAMSLQKMVLNEYSINGVSRKLDIFFKESTGDK